MRQFLSIAAAALVAAGMAPGQTARPLAFEVASVKPVPTGQWRESKIFDDRIDFPYTTLRSCVAMAYGLKEYQVFGPQWISEARYDIKAKAPAGARRDQLPEMLKTLLADRFRLELRQEKKEFSVYTLIVGRNGPKLTESAKPDPAAGARFGISMTNSVGRLEGRNADMTALANTLPRFVGRPVVNQTELAGRYDFDLEFSPDDTKGMRIDLPADPKPIEFGASIFTSVQQFGLKLEGRKLPLDSITVERAERTPTEN